MGLRKLATFYDNLRNSPRSNRNIWVGIMLLGVGWHILIKLTNNLNILVRILQFKDTYLFYIIYKMNIIMIMNI